MKTVSNWRGAIAQFWQLMDKEQARMGWALLAGLLNSGLNLLAPFLIGYGIDHFIQTRQYPGLLKLGMVLLGVYLLSLGAHYAQMILMGSVGQNVLFLLRERIFSKLQTLPVAFFNQHKAGDLISRINNDTDKLNQFLSESLVRFMGSLFIMSGAGLAVVLLHPRLGLVALAPSLLLLLWTRLLSPWVKKQNALQLEKTGGLSAAIQENLSHFKELLVFDRRDYFRSHFAKHNLQNYQAAMGAGMANGVFGPIFDLHYNLAHLSVLGYGLWLFQQGEITLGLLISFLTYVNRYYDPLRQMALLWASFQLALASWDRINGVLQAGENLAHLPPGQLMPDTGLLSFKDVCFHYPGGSEVLHHVSFTLEPGKTYALVGPTGGGKSTTAALMARLYDPNSGLVTFQGRDLREFSDAERSKHMGFILQEPFLFAGTVKDNLVMGHPELQDAEPTVLNAKLSDKGLTPFLERFAQGLDTPVGEQESQTSLGQKQLLAFMRAVLREPELLILDEATANIDTVTEQALEAILSRLPEKTTRVIIAHRLNTIENADQIFFVNDGQIQSAGSFEQAVALLMQEERKS